MNINFSHSIGNQFREAGVPVTETLIKDLFAPKNLIRPPGSEFEIPSKNFSENDFNRDELQRYSSSSYE